MSAAPGRIRYEAPVACPSCGRAVACRWIQGRETADQQCPACGRVFEATWPGFDFEPETVIVEQETASRGAHDAA